MIAPFRQLFGFNFNLKLKFEEYGAVEDSEESGYFFGRIEHRGIYGTAKCKFFMVVSNLVSETIII